MKGKLCLCLMCMQHQPRTNFWTHKDGSRCLICKTCLIPYYCSFKTLNDFCEDMNIPYVNNEWNKLIERHGIEGSLGRYYSKMKLLGYKNFSYADTPFFEHLEKEKNNELSTKEAVITNIE